MKICPQCQTTYTDNSLQFCLQDGSPLVNQTVSQNLTEAETIVSPKNSGRMNVDFNNAQTAGGENNRQTQIPAAPVKSNTGLTVALTALITLLVIGGVIAGVLFYERNKKIETTQNSNANTKTVNVNLPILTNNNQRTNANVNAPGSPAPSATPSAKPTLNPKQVETTKSDVADVIENWKDASVNRDIDGHLGNYADTVDYYRAGKVSLAKVRADKEKAYSAYDNIQINIDNVKITPDETGEKAVAVFDKEWNFQANEKSNSGKVQQQLTFNKISGKWRITGERDLKIYYVDKNQE